MSKIVKKKWSTLKLRTCLAPWCDARFLPRAPRQYYCGSAKLKEGCAYQIVLLRNRQRMHSWRNTDLGRAYIRGYYRMHKETILENQRARRARA